MLNHNYFGILILVLLYIKPDYIYISCLRPAIPAEMVVTVRNLLFNVPSIRGVDPVLKVGDGGLIYISI